MRLFHPDINSIGFRKLDKSSENSSVVNVFLKSVLVRLSQDRGPNTLLDIVRSIQIEMVRHQNTPRTILRHDVLTEK